MNTPRSLPLTIPPSLLNAKAAFEARLQRQAAIWQKKNELTASATRATARIPELDKEAEGLRGVILGDDALAGVADDDRLSPEARAATEQRLAALGAERAALADQVAQSSAGATALGGVVEARELESIDSARAFLKEWRAWVATVWIEFGRDVRRLRLEELFKKRHCIAGVLGYLGMTERLNALTITRAAPTISGIGIILGQGRYYDPDSGEEIDWTATWRSDAALVDLNRSLAAAAARARWAEEIVKGADDARRQAAERLRLDEGQRQARLAAGPKSTRTPQVAAPAPAPAAPAYGPGRSWLAPVGSECGD